MIKIIIVYIEATKSSSNTPNEFRIFLSIIFAGNTFRISKNLKKINIKAIVNKSFKK